MVKFDYLGYALPPHPPCGLDLALRDYFLFPYLKIWIQEKSFHTNVKDISKVETSFQEFDKSYYYNPSGPG